MFFGCLLFVWFVFEVLFWVCCFGCFGLVVFCAVFTGLPSKPALLNAEWRLLLSISHWDITTRIMKSQNKKQQLWSNFQSCLPREIACYWSKLRALCKKKAICHIQLYSHCYSEKGSWPEPWKSLGRCSFTNQHAFSQRGSNVFPWDKLLSLLKWRQGTAPTIQQFSSERKRLGKKIVCYKYGF